MYITKSLFVEFLRSPKLARRHINHKPVYKAIQDHIYGDFDGATIGQQVEDTVLAALDIQDVCTLDQSRTADRHNAYHQLTQTALTHQHHLYIQPAFLYSDLFTKSDLLIKNEQGTYDLIEVKAKSTIRKKSGKGGLLENLIADVSIQRYILARTLGRQFSGRCFIAHLDKTFTKDGPVDPKQLILTADVTDELWPDEKIESTAQEMRKALSLSQDEFNASYPYDGKDHMTYFGQPAPTNSIRSLPRLDGTKKSTLYQAGTVNLADFTETDRAITLNTEGQPTQATRTLDLRQQGEEVINIEEISKQFSSLEFPLYFYDYEAISTPVPLMDGTSPRQQLVVQYSIHQIDEDGTITHREAIMQPHERSNRRILDQLMIDLNPGQPGTYIVWNQGYENKRNDERAERYPDCADQLQRINNHTYDLMLLFAHHHYFHRAFEGSASIKRVLPVLTNLSYDTLSVKNGAQASNELLKLIMGEYGDKKSYEVARNLLEYCKMDTRAMVEIWRAVKGKM